MSVNQLHNVRTALAALDAFEAAFEDVKLRGMPAVQIERGIAVARATLLAALRAAEYDVSDVKAPLVEVKP